VDHKPVYVAEKLKSETGKLAIFINHMIKWFILLENMAGQCHFSF
jgi:hypothetical protein